MIVKNYTFVKEDVHVDLARETLVISYALFLKYQLKVGMDISEETMHLIKKDRLYENLYQSAKTYLKRQHTVSEVYSHLEKQSSDQVVITQVIQSLKDKHYVNDEDFIKRYIQSHKYYGPKKIVFALKNKGVPTKKIEAQLKNVDFQQRLEEVIASCIQKNKHLSHTKKRQKCYVYASQLGYEQSDIQTHLESITTSTDNEAVALKKLWTKKQSKLKGQAFDKCQQWIRIAMQQGFRYDDAKKLCQEIDDV
jgi:SOS response regulatory protein OraA/RecX